MHKHESAATEIARTRQGHGKRKADRSWRMVERRPDHAAHRNVRRTGDFGSFEPEVGNVGYLAYNSLKPPFDNPKVRQALLYGLMIRRSTQDAAPADQIAETEEILEALREAAGS